MLIFVSGCKEDEDENVDDLTINQKDKN